MTKYEAKKKYLCAVKEAGDAARALDAATVIAFEALETWLAVTGVGSLDLSRSVPYLGEGGDYHDRITGIGLNDHGELVLREENGDGSDWRDRDNDVLLSVLKAIDLPK